MAVQNSKNQKKKNWNKKNVKPGTLVVIVVVSWPICILLGEGEKAKKEKKLKIKEVNSNKLKIICQKTNNTYKYFYWKRNHRRKPNNS